MNKPFANAAMALLISLGAVACSSGGGGASGAGDLQPVGITPNSEPKKKTINNNTAEGNDGYTTLTTVSDAAKKAEEAAQAAKKAAEDAAKAEKEAAEKKAQEEAAKAEQERQKEIERRKLEEAERQKKLDEEARAKEEAAKTQADEIANGLVSSYFAQNKNSKTSEYLANKAKQEALLNTTGRMDNKDLKGATAYSLSATKAGDILLSKKQSYSGYTAIREEVNPAGNTVSPVNSYLAIVTAPTTDKSVVPTDAHYEGSAIFSAKNVPAIQGYTAAAGVNVAVSLDVKNDTISGTIQRTTGKKPLLVTLNSAQIQQAHDAVVFKGEASFTKDIGVPEGTKGTYQGQFAGAKAEEVVGTFESNSTETKNSVQGAFMGKQVATSN